MRIVRALTFALIAWAVLLVLNGLAGSGPPAYRHLLTWLGWGAFLPAALSFGGAITGQKGLVLLTLFFVVLGIFPTDLQHFARALAPIGLGILAGAACRAVLEESGATEFVDGD
jgi:hypothetical protein